MGRTALKRSIPWGESQMFKLIVVTLAAFVAILQIFGDPARRPEVSRAAPELLTLASFANVSDDVLEELVLPQSQVSDEDAIRIALAASKAVRDERLANRPLRRGAQARELAVATEQQAIPTNTNQDYWYVSGSKVNLRQGPGTTSAVVAQVTLGTEAMVLDRQNGWMQIETTDGNTSGWIYGKFLNEQKPG